MSTVTNMQVAVKYPRNVGSLSIDMSADNRTTTLSQHINRRLTDMLADISSDTSRSTDTWLICRPTYRSTLGRYVDWYVGQLSVNTSTDMSVEVCTKYTWSLKNASKHLYFILWMNMQFQGENFSLLLSKTTITWWPQWLNLKTKHFPIEFQPPACI